MKTFRNPETIHAPLAGYSHQVEISGAKRWLVLSGQVGMLVDGTLLVEWLGDFTPCSTLLYVAALANPDIKVEIDVLACE